MKIEAHPPLSPPFDSIRKTRVLKVAAAGGRVAAMVEPGVLSRP